MHCANCGEYYRLTPYNDTHYCDACLTEESDILIEYEEGVDEIEKQLIVNPSGKTPPIFYD